MFKPYVFRIVSLRRKVGKTSLGITVARKLVELGYSVSVIKHAGHHFDLEDKDSAKYMSTGVERVIVSGPDILAIYIPKHVDDLVKALDYVATPIVLVEGFTKSNLGDAIFIAREPKDLEHVKYIPNLIAILVNNSNLFDEASKTGLRILSINDVDSIVDIIIERARKHIYEQLPGTNCSVCGYSSCIKFVEAYLRGETLICPLIANITLKIDGKPIYMNPFVKSILRGLIKGFIGALKNIPKDYKRVEIKVEF